VAENRRTSTRHGVELPITLVMNGVTTELRTMNLSLGGALIGMQRLPMGVRVTLRFAVPTQGDPIEAGATVRWSTDNSVGVQFDGLRAKDVWALNKYFEQLDSD
jgi:hypothetical protein